MPSVWLVRHGQTEWSRDGRHTGRTDLDLTAEGEEQAKVLAGLAGLVAEGSFDLILCSPRCRAQRTAELAGFVPFEVCDELHEWDYGEFEGLTSSEIRESYPGWTIWSGPWVGGETAAEVAVRGDALISRLRSSSAERVLLVGHGHFSRVLGARWVGTDVAAGQWLEFDTACWSELGWDRGVPVLRHWNVPARR